MVSDVLLGIIGAIGTVVIAPITVWKIKGWLDSLARVEDVKEVREMAQGAQRSADDAQNTAIETRNDLDKLVGQLVESTSDVDTPLLARIQDNLEDLRDDVNAIEAELRRQSRVETEQTVNLGRLVSALEQSGVEVDEDLRDELEDRIPNDSPQSPDTDDRFYRGGHGGPADE